MIEGIDVNFKTPMPKERNFGTVFTFIFLIISFYPLLFLGQGINYYSLFISVLLLVITIFRPKLFRVPNQLWFKFSIFISKVMTPLIMLIIYVISVVPIGLIIKLIWLVRRKNKIQKLQKSFWVKREKSLNSMKYPF